MSVMITNSEASAASFPALAAGGGFVVGIEGDVNGSGITGDGIDGTGFILGANAPRLMLRSAAALA